MVLLGRRQLLVFVLEPDPSGSWSGGLIVCSGRFLMLMITFGEVPTASQLNVDRCRDRVARVVLDEDADPAADRLAAERHLSARQVGLPSGTPSKGRLSRRVRVPVTLRADAVGRKVTGSDRLVPCAKRSGGLEAPGPEKAGSPVKRDQVGDQLGLAGVGERLGLRGAAEDPAVRVVDGRPEDQRRRSRRDRRQQALAA